MGYIGKLLVKLGLDSKEFDNGLNSAQKKSTDFSGAITKMGTAIIAAFSVDAVINFGKSAVKAYNESALAAAKLNAVLKSTGGVAGQSAEEIQALAANLQKTTTFEDDATIAAASLLATFRSVSGQNFEQAIKSAQDLSTIMGGDLNGAVLQLGKALEDPERGLVALRKSGVSFTQTQIEGIKQLISEGRKYEAQQLILKEVNTQVGGAAKAAGDTAAGAWTKAANAAGDFMEVLGSGTEKTKGFASGLENYFSVLTEIWGSEAAGVGFLDKLYATFNAQSDAAQRIRDDKQARADEIKQNRLIIDGYMKQIKTAAQAQQMIKDLGGLQTGWAQGLKDELNNFIKREQLRKDELAATKAQLAQEKQLEEARKGFGAIPNKQREIEALQEKIKNASAVELPALNDALYARQQELELLKQVNSEIFKRFQQELQSSTEKFQSLFADSEAKAKANVEVDMTGTDVDANDIIAQGDEALKKFQAQQEKAAQMAQMFNSTIASSISGGIQALVGSIMETGELDFGSVLGALLAPFGDLAIQLGEMALATGIGITAILDSLATLNPGAAIAAGIALIALGSVIKAGVSMLGKSKGKSNGGATSQSTTAYTGGGSAYTPNVAMANMNINVTGRISGNDIVLSYDKTKDNKSR